MIKASFVFPFLLSLLACFASCVQDEENSGSAGANGRILTINYSFDTPTTRVTANSLERKVEDVAILFYGTDNAYVACQTATVPTGSSGSFPVTLPSAIQAGVEYKLLVIGNYNEYRPGAEDQSLEDYAGTYSAMSYPKMKENIHAAVYGTNRISGLLPFYGHPADAENGDIMLTPSVGGGTSLGLSVQFSRSVARFNLINRAADKLKIKWVKVCNYRDKGYHFHENLTSGPVVRGTAAGEPNPLPAGYVQPTIENLTEGLQEFTSGGLYAFPNAVINTEQNDEKTTFLMIAGYYKGPSDGDYSTQLTYYRANMSENTTNQILKRNYIYTLTVNGVTEKGADNEEGAADKNQNILDYDVDDKWEEESGNTVTDSDGNELKLSRNTVILAGNAGASALVKVTVTEGTSWVLQWEDEAADEYFDYTTAEDDPHSFNIIAKEDNEDDIIRRGKLKVKLTGVSSDTFQYVDVMQLSSKYDPSLLVVDDKTSDFSRNVSANGETISLKVITGSAACRWQAEYDEILPVLLEPNNPNIVNGFSTGSNNGALTLKFKPNLQGTEMSGTVRIRRLIGDDVDNDAGYIDITFTQPPSSNVMTVSLLPGNLPVEEGVVIEAFNTTLGTYSGWTPGQASANCILATRQFVVNLTDYNNYECEVTSSFNQTSDAFVSTSSTTSTARSGALRTKQKSDPSTIILPWGNETFYLHVFRMGPCDEDIKGTITVKAKRRAGVVTGPAISTYSFNVTLRSTGSIMDIVTLTVPRSSGYLRYATIYVADRNVNAPTYEEYPVALSYTSSNINTPNDESFAPNSYFLGTTFGSQATGLDKCLSFGYKTRPPLDIGWRRATEEEWTGIIPRLCMSKQRYFLISEVYGTDDAFVACWLPAAENTTIPYGGRVSSVMRLVNGYTTIPYLNTLGSGETAYLRCVRDYNYAP